MPYSYEPIACGDLPLTVFFQSVQSCSPHWHEEYEVIFVLKGSLLVQVGQERIILHTGDMLLIHGGDIHLTHGITSDNIALILQFKTAFAEAYDKRFRNRVFKLNPESLAALPGIAKELQRAMASIMWEKRQQQAFHELAIATQLHRFVALLLRDVPWELRANRVDHEERLRDNGAYFTKLRKIIAYIDAHYAEKLCAKEVADHVGISTGYLSRFFHEKVGSSFIDFVNLVRINKSLGDLERGERTIIDIAMDFGFPSVKSYNAFFRKTYGSTPSEWRKSNVARTRSNQFERQYGLFDNVNALSLLKIYMN